jgi:hypothetical protein
LVAGGDTGRAAGSRANYLSLRTALADTIAGVVVIAASLSLGAIHRTAVAAGVIAAFITTQPFGAAARHGSRLASAFAEE